ncbi:MAG: RnfABCDGE type electron transport complex subunit D [Desulfobacterales bacterium]|jgi:electron transport complex protein RnfD|nr:RnfABCDGE type electron transport complex subunit D [Desulfobacterales bacterium]
MISQKKFIVSHAPFWHCGRSVSERSYHTMLAAVPAVLAGIISYGPPALGVVAFSIATAMLWEVAFNRIAKQPISIGDGNAALIGMVLAMLMPATMPWWGVLVGTFIAIFIGKMIFGGIGSNPFNPVIIAVAILMVSWKHLFDFDGMLVNYNLEFLTISPLVALKSFGVQATTQFNPLDLLLGRQVGGIGATFGLGIILGGLYLILRGFIRWEISISFLVGIAVTAVLFNLLNPAKYGGPLIHLLSGYTLLGAFFLATEDSSSPVNMIPMFIYGALGGVMTVLIRNIGIYADGVVYAILVINLVNPLLDKIRPKAIGKVA